MATRKYIMHIIKFDRIATNNPAGNHFKQLSCIELIKINKLSCIENNCSGLPWWTLFYLLVKILPSKTQTQLDQFVMALRAKPTIPGSLRGMLCLHPWLHVLEELPLQIVTEFLLLFLYIWTVSIFVWILFVVVIPVHKSLSILSFFAVQWS